MSDMTYSEVIAIRNRLREFVSFEEGEKARKALKEYAEAHYSPQHTPSEYLAFMNEHECSFKVIHPQSENFPYYWGLFTVKSQHVHGDCIEECLDKAMEGE